MANPTSKRIVIKRGDAWDGETFSLTKTAFDFTGVTVKMQVRDKPDGTVYLTLNPTPTTGVGSMSFSVSFTGAQTATFPTQKLVADVQIYRASALYGPYTVMNYIFDVHPDITQ